MTLSSERSRQREHALPEWNFKEAAACKGARPDTISLWAPVPITDYKFNMKSREHFKTISYP